MSSIEPINLTNPSEVYADIFSATNCKAVLGRDSIQQMASLVPSNPDVSPESIEEAVNLVATHIAELMRNPTTENVAAALDLWKRAKALGETYSEHPGSDDRAVASVETSADPHMLKEPEAPVLELRPQNIGHIIADLNDFAGRLFTETCKKVESGKNAVVFPSGVYRGLSLLIAGAGPQSLAFHELRRLLMVSENEELGGDSLTHRLISLATCPVDCPGYNVSFDLALGSALGGLSTLPSRIARLFGMDMSEASNPMNTELTITEKFQGEWENGFSAWRTSPQEFFTPSGKVQAPMMSADLPVRMLDYRDLETGKDYMGVVLPYTSGAWFGAIVPVDDAEGLSASGIVEKNGVKWLVDFLSDQSVPIESLPVSLPKMTLKGAQRSVTDVYETLGLESCFESEGGLAGMSRLNRPTRISDISWKGGIDFDEKGTRFESVTTLTMASYGMPTQFIANRPFVAAVVAPNGEILSLMKIDDPTKAEI